MHCVKCGQKECRQSDLIAEIERLRAALLEAANNMHEWGLDASPYFRDTWGLDGLVEKYKRIAAGEKE
jgi:hypothetical protein